MVHRQPSLSGGGHIVDKVTITKIRKEGLSMDESNLILHLISVTVLNLVNTWPPLYHHLYVT
jgi:hypothetical protein